MEASTVCGVALAVAAPTSPAAPATLTVEVLSDSSGSHFAGVGARLWPASVLLAQLLLRPAALGQAWTELLAPAAGRPPRALRVLELGAGTALPGICLACLGHRVVCTDLPSVLPVVQANLDANRGRLAGEASAEALAFGDLEAARRLGAGVELVLASDVAYDPVAYAPLLATLRALGGDWQALVSVSQRQDGLGEETFENACRDAGVPLRLRFTALAALAGGPRTRRVNVYELRAAGLRAASAAEEEEGRPERAEADFGQAWAAEEDDGFG